MHLTARYAVSRRGIARAVLRDAGHEAIQTGAAREGAVLIERGIATAAQFVPADSSLLIAAGSHLHRLADQERFVRPKIVIRHAGHEAIANGVDVIIRAAAGRLG